MFPLDSIDMDKYIFNESNQTWENYLSNIKKLLIQPCIPCITTNDTIFEEKNNKKEKKVTKKRGRPRKNDKDKKLIEKENDDANNNSQSNNKKIFIELNEN